MLLYFIFLHIDVVVNSRVGIVATIFGSRTLLAYSRSTATSHRCRLAVMTDVHLAHGGTVEAIDKDPCMATPLSMTPLTITTAVDNSACGHCYCGVCQWLLGVVSV